MSTSGSTKIPCSVGVLTFNCASDLRRCLESVGGFSEIIVCDGGSTDETVAVAKEYGATVILQDPTFKYPNNKIADFAGVRNQMLETATHDWFLIVDSDEYLSTESKNEIQKVIEQTSKTSPKIFYMPRKYEVDNVLIDCAGTYPGYQLRFFNKTYTIGFRRKLHEKIVGKPGVQYGHLVYPTIVPMSLNYDQLKDKFAYYMQLDKERNQNTSKKELWRSARHSARAVIVRWVNVLRNALFCRGRKMPLRFELISSNYSLKLCLVLSGILIKKLFIRK